MEKAEVRFVMYVSGGIELAWKARSRREAENIAFVRWISDALGRRSSVFAGSEVRVGRVLDTRFVEYDSIQEGEIGVLDMEEGDEVRRVQRVVSVLSCERMVSTSVFAVTGSIMLTHCSCWS